MLISQLVPFGRQQLNIVDVAANLAIAVGAVGNASGRIFSGWLSDTIGRLQTLRLMVGVSILAFLVLPHIGGVVTLYGLVSIVYWCYGTQQQGVGRFPVSRPTSRPGVAPSSPPVDDES